MSSPACGSARPDVRLTRVGGPFTAEQRVRARDLGVLDAIHVLPFVDRATLGAVYRRSALALLPSDREGFGLPIVEALAHGTPMVASDIPVLREIGSGAVTYCPVGGVSADWVDTILRLLRERETDAAAWRARRTARPGARGRLQLVALHRRRRRPLSCHRRSIAGRPDALGRSRGALERQAGAVRRISDARAPRRQVLSAASGRHRARRRDALPVEPRARRESRARGERLARHDSRKSSTACT